eukprot:tig00001532_g9279.t1
MSSRAKARTRPVLPLQLTVESKNEFQYETWDADDDAPVTTCHLHEEHMDNFRVSAVLRRFPALRQLAVEDVKRILTFREDEATKKGAVVAKPVAKRAPQAGSTAKSGTYSYVPEGVRPSTITRSVQAPPPFLPVNPSEARQALKEDSAYVGAASPYDAERRAGWLKAQEEAKKRTGGSWVPSSGWTDARERIKIGYTMTSPDEEALKRERERLRRTAPAAPADAPPESPPSPRLPLLEDGARAAEGGAAEAAPGEADPAGRRRGRGGGGVAGAREDLLTARSTARSQPRSQGTDKGRSQDGLAVAYVDPAPFE